MTMTVIARGAYVAEQPNLIGGDSRLIMLMDYEGCSQSNNHSELRKVYDFY